MKLFDLASPAVPANPPRSLSHAVIYGSLSFAVVSGAAYSIWAFRLVGQTALLYATIALVYLGVGGLALGRLIAARGAWKRFPLIFAAAFFLYAVGWCVCWFGLRGKYLADLWGAVVGLAAMVFLLRGAFRATAPFVVLFTVLLLAHSLGYYLGGELYAKLGGPTGRLAWGVAHGLGFGAGLGFVLHRLQFPTDRTS